ncbi:20S proteasome subunit beta 2 [Pancytospora philotis]|nr:20S proteasome subunit beta 2 [Pancytospora philotis]KAI4292294.1 20S proteasome subunit beta 2 [Pancytospora philotis]
MQVKTGTTIVGIKYKTGVILCADTRSTSGPVVADKNCEKIHFIYDNMMCCGAGTAADTRRVTRKASREMQLFAYRHMRRPYVAHAQRLIADYLHSYGGHIGAALVLGGIEASGPQLCSISPHGYSADRDFTSMGSGSYAAISVLQAGFRRGMSKEEAMELGVSAVKAGILNDLYSGSNVDVCVMDEAGIEHHRNYLKVETRKNSAEIRYPEGSVHVLKEDIYRYVEEVRE